MKLVMEEPWPQQDGQLRGQGDLKEINLIDKEQKIFGFLMEVLEENDANTTTLRVAGGWVRDKLLGLQSNDIDIAIDNMLGS